MAIPKFFKNNNGKISLENIGIDQSVGASDGHKVIVTESATGKMHKSFIPGNNGFDYVGSWAGKPASLTNNYTDRIFITDVGVGGTEWYWDGAEYRVVGGEFKLPNTNTGLRQPVTCTLAGTTTTNLYVLDSVKIPANILSANDEIIFSWTPAKVSDISNTMNSAIYLSTTQLTTGSVATGGSTPFGSTTTSSASRTRNCYDKIISFQNSTTLNDVNGTNNFSLSGVESSSAPPNAITINHSSDLFLSPVASITTGTGVAVYLLRFTVTIKKISISNSCAFMFARLHF